MLTSPWASMVINVHGFSVREDTYASKIVIGWHILLYLCYTFSRDHARVGVEKKDKQSVKNYITATWYPDKSIKCNPGRNLPVCVATSSMLHVLYS